MLSTKPVKRIAMWSGPRNISTAMMRAWENRSDTAVIDEPLYGHYLHHTQIPHPGADEVIAAQGEEWTDGVKRCFVPLAGEQTIHYQKHMTMHLLDHIDRTWLAELSNCFLIRHPAQVLASYAMVRESPTLHDIGFEQQAALFDYVKDLGNQPGIVIDSAEFLSNPSLMLNKLCDALEIEFDSAMLSWPIGPRDSDGVWSKYWYDSVNKSSGFAPYKPKALSLTEDERVIVEQALPYYEYLYEKRLR